MPAKTKIEYIHRYITDEEAGHPVDPITTGWSPRFMSCKVCKGQIIEKMLAAELQIARSKDGEDAMPE